LTPELLHAGRVGRPHGLDGSFYVIEPAPQLLPLGAQVWVGERPTEVLRRAGTDARPILRVGLASDRTEIEALRGVRSCSPRRRWTRTSTGPTIWSDAPSWPTAASWAA